MKNFLIAGNWKMNMLREDTRNFVNGLKEGISEFNLNNIEVLICPTFTSLGLAQKLTNGTKISLGAQNMHFEEKGAFTGEISPNMLLDSGCKYVIIGHSERRQYFNEDNSLLSKKLQSAFNSGLLPIFCIGETIEQRQTGVTFEILEKQLSILNNFEQKSLEKLVIAYEPVWAIGTGLTATTEQILEVHKWIAEYLMKNFKIKIKILYGGSMNAKNAAEILSTDYVSGGLIGGASLVAEQFLSIINVAVKLVI